MSEILKEIEKLSGVIEAASAKNAELIEASKKSFSEQIDEAKTEYGHLKSELDEIKKMQSRIKTQAEEKVGGFKAEMKSILETNKENIEKMASGFIREFKHGVGVDFIEKAVADMTIANNLVGNAVRTYGSGIIPIAYRMPHVRSLVDVIPSATDSYSYYQHSGGEGALDWQSAEGAAKAQFDEDFTERTVALRYLAGYVILTRQILRNIPGLLAYLNKWLPEKYMRAEDSKFYDFVAAESGMVTFNATGTNIERLIRTIADVAGNGHGVNGIAINPAAWARIVLTKGATSGDYTLPPGVAMTASGDMSIFGVPVYTTSWVADDKAIVADWKQFGIVQSEGMSVRFSEEHGTLLTQNKVLALVEASIGFTVEDKKAVSFGDLGDVA